MGLKDIKDWALGQSDEELDSSNDLFDAPTSAYETSGFDGMTSDFTNKESQLVVFEPRSYAEAQSIADHLKARRGCIINLHRVTGEQATRIIDFLSGVIYAIEGNLQKTGADNFLATPPNFGVAGQISEDNDTY
ncbi:MAG: cell division protein SepF [Bacilli bacterium]|jgi:cell division inhibitor SepF|nr:cell division protein SepF [Bacilli bacterium]